MTTWTEEETTKAVDLWNAGQTSLQIAHGLGRSRSAILGRLFRLGILHRETKIKEPTKRKPPLPLPPERPLPAQHVTFADLEPGMCRWPFGAVMPYRFCGCPTVPEQSYCPTHQEASIVRIYRRTEPKIDDDRLIRARRAILEGIEG